MKTNFTQTATLYYKAFADYSELSARFTKQHNFS